MSVPRPTMEIHFKPRMNFLTGDNGLGKTFLLDIAWWVLTRTWARMPVIPPHRFEGGETPDTVDHFMAIESRESGQKRSSNAKHF